MQECQGEVHNSHSEDDEEQSNLAYHPKDDHHELTDSPIDSELKELFGHGQVGRDMDGILAKTHG